MLEWMHDKDIAAVFQNSFQETTLSDAENFIRQSWLDSTSLHFAFCADGEYMGTISLKSIDLDNLSAEYAISTRSKAHGTGLAKRATDDVLRFAFEQLKLHRIYLNVRRSNARAISFYEKYGFEYEGAARDAIRIPYDAYEDLLWFSILAPE